MATVPLPASQIAQARAAFFPEKVFEAVNEMLTRKFNTRSGQAIIRQDELVALMIEKGLDRGEIFNNGWLDFEQVYLDAGWNVTYDKSDYTDSSPSTFIFKKIA